MQTDAGTGVIERRMADKRARIVEAALTLFAQRGYHGTAVPLVAQQAGVGAGTIYRFFEDKEALVNGVFRDAKTQLGEALLDGLTTNACARDLFEQFWTRLCTFAREQPTAFHFLELQDHVPYLDDESRALEQRILAPIFAACAFHQRRGALRRDMRVEAMMAWGWGAFVGLMKAERMGYVKVDNRTLVQAREACWRAFAPDSPPKQAKRATRGTASKRSSRSKR